MISKESADIAADALIARARATPTRAPNFWMPPQHLLSRFPELQALPPEQHAKTLLQCMRIQRSVDGFLTFFFAFFVGDWFLIRHASEDGANAFGLMVSFGFLLIVFFRRTRVRFYLRKLVRELPASPPSNHEQQNWPGKTV